MNKIVSFYSICFFLILNNFPLFPAEADETLSQKEPFALGVEYMVPGLAEIYAKTGVRWVKAAGHGFTWGEIEPEPPENGIHRYKWDLPDRVILEYQKAGFTNFHVYVKCRCSWASSKNLPSFGTPSFPPKPEFMKDYQEFLKNLVERYDRDGYNDAPGLLYPIRYWEIEAEWGTFWQDGVDEYVKLLKAARSAIKSADPDAKIILIGFFLAGVFEGNPDPEKIDETIEKRHPPHRVKNIRQGIKDATELLSYPNLFDIVEFHSLSDWTEIIGMARFLKSLMKRYGYEKPIWAGDVNYTAPPLMFWGNVVPPYTEDQRDEILRTLNILANKKHPRHEMVERWFRAEQSSGLVKKAVLAMGEGLAGINIGNLTDWDIFALAPAITGTAAFHGLIETEGVKPARDKHLSIKPLIPGKPRPAYYALEFLAKKIAGFTEVQKLPSGAGIYNYRFIVNSRTIYALWYDDGKRYLASGKTPSISIGLKVQQKPHIIYYTPTLPEHRTPPSMHLTPVDGILRIEVGSIPVFIEELNN